MTQKPARPLSRRLFLRSASLIGCSAAAWPLLSPVTFASAPGDARLVVIILRGAMDGLDVVRPIGDPDYATYRHASLTNGKTDPALNDFYALHPAMADLMPLWKAGELGFAHAVATPYRDKRSHFDGQDILEAGTGLDVPQPQVRDGWLNRMLQAMPDLQSDTAYAVGRDEMKVIEGSAPSMSWAPKTQLRLSDQSQRLLERIYEDDPLFHAASQEAIEISARLEAEKEAQATGMARPAIKGQAAQLAGFAASRLREDTQIATFSIGGWDTHRNQRNVLAGRLGDLSGAILALKSGLGRDWGKTTVLAMTEFGRTARENGTGGTDHGTGGALIMAGGAIRGGQVYGHWPDLADHALFEQRDLMPTADVRAYAAWAMRGMFGFEKGLLESTVFPSLDMGDDPKIIS
ncbi:DUF1501 domain-containing protein [Thioclava indica]|uniref:Twin-arginine translocation pathway signal n=1 Tax=Thioclava indica TaxID=1353528 RepID=A0A074JSM6_9RHOB|nr:DUF1501 domain-containing protein [Thioclava indica]KEO60636.1 hypothetical protein DT23_13020 [Thioclava indica]